jgi:DNA-binding response OmpR family regulator
MKILVIEDDEFFRKFYTVKLKENNFEVDSAENGEEGLKKIAENKPDLLLLDLIMPIKDGYDVLEALSQADETKQIPVLVFSTLGQEKDIEKALQMGARGYINKSFYDIDKLLKKIFEVSASTA